MPFFFWLVGGEVTRQCSGTPVFSLKSLSSTLVGDLFPSVLRSVCSPPGYSVHGILQTKILVWYAISYSRGSSQPTYWSHVSWINRQILWPLGKPLDLTGEFTGIDMSIPWWGRRTRASLLFLDCSSFFSLHSLPFLINNCLNLPCRIQERSRKWNEVYFLQTSNVDKERICTPTGFCSVSLSLKTNKQTNKKKKLCHVENKYWVAGDPVPQISGRLTNVKILML